jgi:hypothetical protein
MNADEETMEEWSHHLKETYHDLSLHQVKKVLYTSQARKMGLEGSDFKQKMEIADQHFFEILSLQLLLSNSEDTAQPAREEEEKPSAPPALPALLHSTPPQSEDAGLPALEEGKNGDAVKPLLDEGSKREAASQKACCSIM